MDDEKFAITDNKIMRVIVYNRFKVTLFFNKSHTHSIYKQ